MAQRVMRAKRLYCFDPHFIALKVLAEKLPEIVLFLILPYARFSVAVVNGINIGLVPATILRGKRILFVQTGAIQYLSDGIERTLIEGTTQ
jgi:hypothetical protein